MKQHKTLEEGRPPIAEELVEWGDIFHGITGYVSTDKFARDIALILLKEVWRLRALLKKRGYRFKDKLD